MLPLLISMLAEMSQYEANMMGNHDGWDMENDG